MSARMTKPRVSVVQYLNTAPLVWGMLRGGQQGKYDLEFTTPACCADAVLRKRADVGIIPSVEYPRMERGHIISGLSIASKARVKSVLLFSKLPIERVRSVEVDSSSRTSVALLRVLLEKFYSRQVKMSPSSSEPTKMLQNADAALLIGDAALTYHSDVPRVYDLSAEWKKFTGLPFVFAFWAGHEKKDVASFRKDFEDSLQYGLAHLDDIATEYAPRHGMSPEAVKVYLTENINYNLDEENRKGLNLFYKLAHEVGIIPAEKELSFV